jgi:hypothetical protein
MLLIFGIVAKMLVVKSEGACSLTLAPGQPTCFRRDNSGKFHIDHYSKKPHGLVQEFSLRTAGYCLTAALSCPCLV